MEVSPPRRRRSYVAKRAPPSGMNWPAPPGAAPRRRAGGRRYLRGQPRRGCRRTRATLLRARRSSSSRRTTSAPKRARSASLTGRRTTRRRPRRRHRRPVSGGGACALRRRRRPPAGADRRALDEVARVRRQLAAGLTRRSDGCRGRRRGAAPGGAGRVPGSRRAPADGRATRRRARRRWLGELGFEASHDWLVAVDVEERRRGTRTRWRRGAARLGDRARVAAGSLPRARRGGRQPRLRPDHRRVERTSGLRYGALLLDETVAPAPPDEETARLLAAAAVARGLDQPTRRRRAAGAICSGWCSPDRGPRRAPSPVDAAGVAELVRVACQGQVGFSGLTDLRRAGARRAARRRAPRPRDPGARAHHARGAVALSPCNHPPRHAPRIESRLQDFFGTPRCRRIARRARALTVHLPAPNGARCR